MKDDNLYDKDDLQKLSSLLNKYNLKGTLEYLKQETKISETCFHDMEKNSDISFTLTEQYSKLRTFVENALAIHRAELNVLLYPVFVHIYLHLLSLEQFVQAKDFFKLFESYQEEIYLQDIISLKEVTSFDKDNMNPIFKIFNSDGFSLRICRVSLAYFRKLFLEDKSLIDLANVINKRIKIDIYEGDPRSEGELDMNRGAYFGESLPEKNSAQVLYGNLNEPLLDFIIKRKAEKENECGDETGKKRKKNESPQKTSFSRKSDSVSPAMDRIPLPVLSLRDREIMKRINTEINSLPRLRRKCRLFEENMTNTDNILNIERNQINKEQYLKEGIPLNSVMYTMSNLNGYGTSAAFNEDCSMLATGLSSGIIHVRSLNGSGLPVLKSATELDGLYLRGETQMENITTRTDGDFVRDMRGHAGGVYDLAFSTDGRQLVSASSDGTLRLWCNYSWTNIAKFHDRGEPLWAVDIAPLYSHYIATGGNDRCVNLYSADNLKPLRRFTGDCYGPVTCIKFHNNVNYLASGSTDRVVRLFDIRSGGMVRSFTGHKGTINCLQFSEDGQYLLSGCDNGSVNIWNLATHSGLVDTLNVTGGKDNTGGPVNKLALCRDGATLAVGRQAGQVDIWNLNKIIKTNMENSDTVPEQRKSNEFVMPGSRAHPLDGIIDILYAKKTPIFDLKFNRRNMLCCSGVFMQI